MCGLYALFGPHARHGQDFAVDAWPDLPDRYRIPPSTWAPVIRQAPDSRRVADLLRWGLLPHWAKDETMARKLINARGESVADKPSFRAAYRRRRCIVPASGFFEWQAVPGSTRKQPWFVRIQGGGPMAMAGLWESWTSPQGEVVRTFCVITTGANEVMAPIHQRMPVLLAAADWAAWLDPETELPRVDRMLQPSPAGMIETWPVNPRVSRPQEDGPDLVEPVGS